MMKDCHRKCLHDLLPSTMSSCHFPSRRRTVLKSPSQITALLLLAKMSLATHLLELHIHKFLFSKGHTKMETKKCKKMASTWVCWIKDGILVTVVDPSLKVLLLLKPQLDVKEDKHQILMMFSF